MTVVSIVATVTGHFKNAVRIQSGQDLQSSYVYQGLKQPVREADRLY
jgi:hypothetical protein